MTEQSKTDNTKTILRDTLSKLDVDAVGVASLSDWKGTRLEETAISLLPEARSVVVLAIEISPEALDLSTHSRTVGAPSMNDLLNAETDYINSRLNRAAFNFARTCRNLGLKALVLPASGCPTDNRFMEAVFSYKHAGQAAGLGQIGWHSLLITPDFGPRVRLAVCLTEAELEPIKSDFTLHCEGCSICLDKCPATALVIPETDEDYIINKFACSAYRASSGGCSECMRVCPEGR